MNFARFYKCVCQICFQCIILVCETYKLWINKFCKILITKSWDVKFVMKDQTFLPLEHIKHYENYLKKVPW